MKLSRYASKGNKPEDADPIGRTKYTDVTDTTSHRVETVDGHEHHVTEDSDTKENLTADFDDRVMTLIEKADAERQRIEDIRANRRNRNRFLTLLVALLMGFITPLMIHAIGWLWLIPYSFVILILPDTLITLYAYIRKY